MSTKTNTDNITERVGRYLLKGKSITQLQALEMFGCMRLSARIHELRNEGWDINKESVSLGNGKSVARYSMP